MFAAEHSVEEILAEVRDAKRSGRDHPRGDRYGLPNLDEKLVLRFSRSQIAKLRLALASVGREIAGQTGAEGVSSEDALLYLAERRGGESPAEYALLYHTCTECRRARMQTPEGMVEVDQEEVSRIEGDAQTESIAATGPDRPTPPVLRRKILLRDGARCANPRCHHEAVHCHHMVFLSDGGRTALSNEVAVCATCHALIHAGLLTVTGVPGENVTWTTHDESLTARVLEGKTRADRLPVLNLAFARVDFDPTTEETESARADSVSLDLGVLATALTQIGMPNRLSLELVEHTHEKLDPSVRTKAAVLREALTSARRCTTH